MKYINFGKNGKRQGKVGEKTQLNRTRLIILKLKPIGGLGIPFGELWHHSWLPDTHGCHDGGFCSKSPATKWS